MNQVKLKEWIDYPDMVSLLRSRNMYISDEKRAIHYLSMIGYYRLSGYWYPFRLKDEEKSKNENRLVLSDQFKPNTQFNDILELYIFDKKLRLLALDALERIEMAIRNDVVHCLGSKDPCAYVNPNFLHGNFVRPINKKGKDQGKTPHQLWLDKHNQLIERAKRKPFIEHYTQHYHKKLPIWVAAEVWDFGLLSHLYAGMQYKDKEIIAQKYNVTPDILEKWLKSLNFIRNVSAHHSRLWNANILELSPTLPEWEELKNQRIFLYLCIMQKMLSVISPKSQWKERLKLLLNTFPTPKNQAVLLSDMGVVDNWENRELWQK